MAMDETGSRTNQWVERPWAARSIRIAVYAVPLALSIGTSFALTSLLDAPLSMLWSVLRWSLIVVLSTGVLVGTERISRRLMPLATLFKLSLAFPDEVPSRFGLALRIGTTAQLQQRIDAAQRGEIADSPGEAAEQLLELVGLLSHHDRLTRGHSERVRAFTHLVAVEMGISGVELDRLRWAALLHDVGKITIPGAILNKPGRLTDEEFETIKTHPTAGKKLVEPLADWLGGSVRAVWEHHERFDGGGYPQGLAGSEIALASRIVCVTDAFDVMTSTRSYKKPMAAEAARAELSRCAGTQFDPAVVRAFIAASIGTTQTATKPLAFLAQLFLFPRTFLANATATLGAIAALTAGAVVGTVGHTLAADRPSSIPRIVAVEDEEPPSSSAPLRRVVGSIVTSFDVVDESTDRSPQPEPLRPTPTVVRPPETTPDGTVPRSKTPDTTMPDTTVPPATTPDVTVPPATTPDVTVPPVTVPVVTQPPPVTVPVITVPVVTVPPPTVPIVTGTLPPVVVSVPPVSVPPVSAPTVSTPSVAAPPVGATPIRLPGDLF